MRIAIVGGNGTIGKVVTDRLGRSNEVIVAGRTSGEVTVDITSSESISKMYDDLKEIDGVIRVEPPDLSRSGLPTVIGVV